ncbi:MAG: ABC transporter ATP-binding protein [Bacteroidota bacterium]
MITINNISKHFGKLKALDQLNLQFNSGECIALIGPNGSGKTTLIKSILGMVVPDAGSILFNKISISKNWKYRSQIGYMPQIGRYPDNMTIGQVINMMKDIRKSEKNVLDEELVEKFALHDIMNKRMRTLSGGTRQKVSASLAFLFNADVLILDEPTAGLDPVSSEILKEKIVKEKTKGKLIIITSHVLSELDDLITQIVYMQDGKLKFQKEINLLKKETGEEKLSKAIAKIMLQNQL